MITKLRISILLYITLLFISSTITQAQWEQIPSPNNYSVNSFCITPSSILAGTDFGLYRSTNQGLSWTKITYGSSLEIDAKKLMVSNSYIIARMYIGNTDGIFKSIDDGLTWINCNCPMQLIQTVNLSGNNIYVTSHSDAELFFSTNSGVSWFSPSNNGLPFYENIYSPIEFNNGAIFALTLFSGVFKSTNNGEHWTNVSSGLPLDSFFNYSSIAKSGNNLFLACDNYGAGIRRIYRSTNLGQSWTNVAFGLQLNYNNILQGSYNDIFILSNSSVFRSSNNGIQWENVTDNASINFSLYNPSCINQDYLYLVGNKIWKRYFSGIALPSISLTNPNGGQNYFSGYSKNITWNSAGIQNVKLELTTNNGNSWSIINSSYPAVSQSYAWIVPNSPSSQCKIRISDASNSNIVTTSQSVFSISQTSLNTGLVVYYPFDYNANDASGNGNNGIIDGNPTFVLGKNGNAIKLKGDSPSSCTFFSGGDRIRMPLVNFNAMQAFTISMWVNDSLISCDAETYFSQGDDGSPGNSIQIWHFFSNIAFTVGTPSPTLSVPFRDEDRNQFVLYTMTYENGIMKAYRNTELLGSLNQTVNYSSAFAGIGAHYWWGQYSSARFNGKIDDFRIYNRAISSGEIQQLYSQNKSITLSEPNGGEFLQYNSVRQIKWYNSTGENVKIELSTDGGTSFPMTISSNVSSTSNSYNWTIPNLSSANCKIKITSIRSSNTVDLSDNNFTISNNSLNTGLLAYYPLDNNANDFSGNNFNGTLSNSPDFVPGIKNNGVQIYGIEEQGGNGKCVLLPSTLNNSIKSLNSFTISLWVKEQSLINSGGEGYFFLGNHNFSWLGISHFYDPSLGVGRINFSVGANNYNNPAPIYAPFLDSYNNNFVLYTMTYANGIMKAYINGAFVGQLTQTVTLQSPKAALGRHWWGDGDVNYSSVLRGIIDDVRIYNRAISESEVQQLYSDNYLSLTNPKEGETYYNNGVLPIKWETNLNKVVLLEYSIDDGSHWTEIPMSIPSSSKHFDWQIPNGMNSENCKIKISVYDNRQINSVSPKFKIKPQAVNNEALITFKIFSPSELGINKVILKENKLLNHSITKTIVNNEIFFAKSDFLNSSYFGVSNDDKDVLEFYNDNNFKGKFLVDIIKSDIENNKKLDAIIYIDTTLRGLDAGYNGNGWKYYTSADQRVISILVPPNKSFNSINLHKSPLLLVHGINSVYPSWNTLADKFIDDNEYDVWQFYYPHDQKIDASAQQLSKSIFQILKQGGPLNFGNDQYSSNGIKIVAHSMGGLVTRQYIQSNTYKNNISKLLMLGTPNNGSFSVYRLLDEISFRGLNYMSVMSDVKSPATIEMTPGSSFLKSLNDQTPRALKNSGVIFKDYLVIAGTDNCVPLGIHDEIRNQHDGVVAVSSASLLNKDIPLAVSNNFGHVSVNLPLFHKIGISEIDTSIIKSFLNNNYNPSDESNSYYLNLKNHVKIQYFWFDIDQKRKAIGSMDETKGLIIMNTILHDNHSYKISTDLKVFSSIYISKNEVKKTTSLGSFVPNKYDVLSTYNFSTNYNRIPNLNEIGIKINQPSFENIFLVNSDNTKFKLFKHKIYGMQTNYLNFDVNIPVVSTSIDSSKIYLTPAEAKIFLASNYMFENTPVLKQSGKGRNSFLSGEYYFDNSMDSIAIILNSDENDGNFNNHNFHLVSPTGLTVDSNYANSHAGFSYTQNLEGKFAFYFMVKPDTGVWSVNYNSILSNPCISIPINSPVLLNFSENDSTYEAGDTVDVKLLLSGYNLLTNPVIEATASFSKANSDSVLSVSSVSFVHVSDSSFRARFLVTESGNYKVQAKLNAVYKGKSIRRMSFENIPVKGLAKPVCVSPKNDSINTPINATFVWRNSRNAFSYSLQIFNSGDSVPTVITNITDTSYSYTGLLNNTTYFWKVIAISKTESSEYSDIHSFTTIKSIPLAPYLANPSNNSGGVFSPFEFNWNKSVDANSYILQISSSNTFTTIAVQDTILNDTLFNVSGLNPLSRYYWRVKSINEVGEGEFSPEYSFRTMGAPYTITQSFPINQQSNIPVYFYYLSWNRAIEQVLEGDDPNFTFYHLRITKDTNSSNSIYNDSTLVDTTYKGTGLEYETKYYWNIRAKNNAGWSALSSWHSFTSSKQPMHSDSTQIQIGNNVNSVLGASKLTLNSDNTNSAYINANYFVEPPLTGTLPSGINSISSYHWFIKNSGLTFNNGKIKAALNSLAGISDSSKLVWLKRSNPGDPWTNIGGLITNGYLESTILFNSFSEFAIGALDNQSLSSSGVKISFIPSGLYNTISNSLNIRDTFSIALKSISAPFNTIDSGRFVLDSNTFSSNIEFFKTPSATYYIVIYHRNSLQTWSRTGGESIGLGAILNYDFTDGQNKTFGNNSIFINSKWCTVSGDMDQDGYINGNDFTVFSQEYGLSGYLTADLNGDGIVNGNDFTYFSQSYGRQAIFPSAIFVKPSKRDINKKSD